MKRCLFHKLLLIFIFLFIFCADLLHAQETNLVCSGTNIGPILQMVTNQGHMGSSALTFCEGVIHSEYPAGSHITYGVFSVWIGGKRAGRKLVSTGGPWPDHFGNRHELFPTAAPWDSVWVVNRGETVDIPYWPNYTGVSDQDLVCRYNDYTIRTVQDHIPLYIDIIQVTYAWTSLEFLVHQYWIIPQKEDLEDVYFGYMGNMQIGRWDASSFAENDEYGSFDADRFMGIIEDLPEGDDTPLGPIGFRIFPDVPEDSLIWSWHDGSVENWNIQEPPSNDELRYDYMTAGIQHDPIQDRKYGHFLYSCGPFQLPLGDTLHITVGQILGVGFEGMYKNLDRLIWLRGQDYHMPAPPPRPPLRAETGNHQVTLYWDVQTGDVNPETYVDQYRRDGEQEPFEGYRVYKSTVSAKGPWVLLAEYDRSDDDIGENIGLRHSYTDVGLLNNLEYYYTVTAFSKPDKVLGVASQESSLFANSVLVVPGTASPETVGQVAVVPNPYRGDQKYYDFNPPWERPSFGGIWVEEDRRIQFINLPSPCEIKIYTISGKYVNTLYHDDEKRGFKDWNLTSHVGQTIASGIYLFTVKDLDNGKVQVGKFVVIK
ncbi:MAG: hypothetical protein ACE5NG_05705 [bacterium]